MAVVSTQSVQIPVELALGQAQSQIEKLRQALQQSVKPDTSAYRELSNLLDRLSKKSEDFRASMNSSLKTNQGTQKFSKGLEDLFDSLESATVRLANVHGKDLIFSSEDTARLDEINRKIQETQQLISNLSKNKISNIFTDKSSEDFKQIQSIASNFKINVDTDTFSALQKAISAELNKINSEINKTENEIQQFQSVLSNANLKGNTLQTNLTQITSGAVGDVVGASNTQVIIDRLKKFYDQLTNLGAKAATTKVNAGDSVSGIIQAETQNIIATIDAQTGVLKEKYNQYQDAIKSLENINVKNQSKSAFNNVVNSIQGVLKDVKFDESFEGKNILGLAKRMRDAISAAQQEILKGTEKLGTLKDELTNELSNLFNDLDFTKGITNSKGFSNAIKNWLSAQNINLKDVAFTDVFKNIEAGDNFEASLNSIIAAVGRYVANLETAAAQAEEAKARLTGEKTEVEAQGVVVNNAQIANDDTLERAKTVLESLTQAARNFTAEKAKAHKQKVMDENEGSQAAENYNRATQALQQYSATMMQVEAHERTLGNIRTAITNWMGFNQVMNMVRNAVTNAMNHIKQLDTTMNGIAIVTNMSTADLWKQVDAYSDMAQTFGTTIQGAYEVSKIYYQAGYETNEVLTLTNETLKLSKISGLDYATTTDYMMTA